MPRRLTRSPRVVADGDHPVRRTRDDHCASLPRRARARRRGRPRGAPYRPGRSRRAASARAGTGSTRAGRSWPARAAGRPGLGRTLAAATPAPTAGRAGSRQPAPRTILREAARGARGRAGGRSRAPARPRRRQLRQKVHGIPVPAPEIRHSEQPGVEPNAKHRPGTGRRHQRPSRKDMPRRTDSLPYPPDEIDPAEPGANLSVDRSGDHTRRPGPRARGRAGGPVVARDIASAAWIMAASSQN